MTSGQSISCVTRETTNDNGRYRGDARKRSARLLRASKCLLGVVLAVTPLQGRGQVDLSGHWLQKTHEDLSERSQGPAVGDYSGLPINKAARMRAETWDAGRWAVPEHQCEPHPADYAPHGPANMRIDSEVDPVTQEVVAWHVTYMYMQSEKTIWMDGRAHPPAEAPHSWMGFSTGKWVGDMLVSTTTHLKEGWIRRNGVPRSDLGRLTEYWIRHGNYLTVVGVTEDPIYLNEPVVRSWNWVVGLGFQIAPFNCIYLNDSGLPRGYVAHILPGLNSGIAESRSALRTPLAAAYGGANTLYPEFARGRVMEEAPSTVSRGDSVSVQAAHAHRPASRERSSVSAEATRVLPVRGGIFLVSGAGSNITVQVGEQGILVVDSGRSERGSEVLSAIRTLSDKPIQSIVNTGFDKDHTGGNATLSRAGRVVNSYTGRVSLYAPTDRAPIYAHEDALLEMSRLMTNAGGHYSEDSLPSDTYFTESMELSFNRDAIQILSLKGAHSRGDSLVYFRKADVISTGDVFSTITYPHIDIDRGGTVDGLIEALNRIIDIAIPERNQEGGTLVIPGHGRICDEYDVVMYRDMVTIIRDRVRYSMQRDKGLAEILESQPTMDYDGRYGVEDGKRFVREIFRNTKAERRE